MNSHLKAWKEDYRKRGWLWGGRLPLLPSLPSGSTVLELGCGSGKTLSAMLSHPWQVVAVDVSLEAMLLCRPPPNSALNVDFVAADGCLLPFRDEVFDAAFAFHVVGHLPLKGREKIASEVGRVLKHGGRLFFRGFGLEDMRSGQGEEVEPYTFRRGFGAITHYFAEEEVSELFEKLQPISMITNRWQLKVRGDGLLRSEIVAAFLKV